MAKLANLKRILKEDFNKEDQDTIDKLAFVLNPFLEQISNAFNKNINIDNLSREISIINVQNALGVLNTSVQLKTNLNSKIVGITVIRADNLTDPTLYPTQTPFVSWTLNGKIITVLNVTGIQDDNKYQLTLEVIS